MSDSCKQCDDLANELSDYDLKARVAYEKLEKKYYDATNAIHEARKAFVDGYESYDDTISRNDNPHGEFNCDSIIADAWDVGWMLKCARRASRDLYLENLDSIEQNAVLQDQVHALQAELAELRKRSP